MGPRPGSTGPTREGDGSPAPGFGRRVARHAAFVGTVALVATLGAAIALEVVIDGHEFADQLATRASGAINRTVSVGDASLVLFPRPGVHISAVRVDNPAGFEGPPLLESAAARVDLAVLPLFVGRARVRGLRVHTPEIHLAVNERGVSNYGDLLPRSHDSGGSSGARFQVALRRIVTSGARVTYSDAPEDRATTVVGVSLDASLDSDGIGGWRMSAVATSDSFLVVFADPSRERVRLPGPGASWKLFGDTVFDRIEVVDGVMTHGAESLQMEGRIAGLRSASPELDLRIRGQVGAAPARAYWLGGVAPDSSESLTGSVGLAARLFAPAPDGTGLHLRGEVTLQEVSWLRNGVPIAERLTGTVEFAPDTLTLHGVGGRWAGGPFEIFGRVSGPEHRLRVEAWGRPELAELDRLGWAPSWAKFAGNLTLDLFMEGALSEPGSLTLDGSAIVSGLRADPVRFHTPLYVPSGTVSFADDAMIWEDVTVLVGDDPLGTSGRLSGVSLRLGSVLRAFAGLTPIDSDSDRREPVPVIEASFHEGVLDLDALLGRPTDDLETTYAQIAFAHLGERTVGGFGAGVAARSRGLARPTSLPIRGFVALDLDTLSLGPLELQELSTVVEFSESRLLIRDAAYSIWGGEGTGRLSLGVGASEREPFSLELTLDRVVARPFFQTLTPVGEAIDGVMDLHLELSGSTDRTLLPSRDSLSGEGTISLDGGRIARTGVNYAVADFLSAGAWEETAFDRWQTRLEIGNEGFDITRSVMSGPLGEHRLQGALTFDGSTDLSLALSIAPSLLDGISLRKTGVGSEVLAGLQAAQQSLDLGLRLSGPIAGPSVVPDASAAGPGPR